ncbi:uncharacterized protein LOC110614869 [Manihot esculenta]|uniref:uncharacterized protein LOC110614869 n=1 Tax=Manihot esculenta TaxID=3983 RepID=UPI001CC7511F|nr:uncharacterized protein LOC110614869 [Manihot esculenta]
MAKMIVNRLKSILPSIVPENQSAFISGRSIQDNIILAFEAMHGFNMFHRKKVLSGALKMDISKAYDRLEWDFIRDMLIRMGFEQRWVTLVFSCISTVRYWILHDGREIGPILPTRGLRQGDPLLLYLFILCAEGISRLLQDSINRGSLHGFRISRGGPQISHLFFADDSLIFFIANVQEALELKRILRIYEKSSGQLIEEKPNLGNYLGLPSHVGSNKREVFSFVKDRLWKRLNSWKHRALSQAGKERMMTRYWWSKGADQNRGIHWLGWHRMAKHRLDGGLGFKSLHDFNLAMLASLGHNPNFLWRSIWATQSLVKAGTYWRIGNGRDMSCILNIPLSLSSHPNAWCWKFASKGHYSVKSAYRFLLLGFDIGKSRRVPVDSMCPLCHEAPETILHILVQCPFARSCWLSSPLGWPAFSTASLREWFSLAFLTASAENASLILMICWALWHNRNNVVWKAQGRTASGVFFMALNFLQQWRGACSDSTSCTNVVSVLTVWSPPPQGWIKVNIDASLNSQRSSLGFGCVVRDANGRFIAAKAGCFCSQMEVKCAEAVAFREALSWIKECGWDRVLFESDAQVLIVSINNTSLDDLSPFDLLVQDCKLLLSSYEEARCAFIHRSYRGKTYSLSHKELEDES